MNLSRALCVAPFVLLIVIAGCGGGGSGFDPNNVTVTVSPAAVTIPANGQVTLQATVNGAPANAVSSWTIAELKGNGASGAQCDWGDIHNPPPGPCPAGTIQFTDTTTFLTVTYHAPSTSGTFHIIAEWDTVFNQKTVIKDATAVITVSP